MSKHCPTCSHALNAATLRPCEGNFTVCVFCGAALRWRAGELVTAQQEDLRELAMERPGNYILLRKAQEGIERLRAPRN